MKEMRDEDSDHTKEELTTKKNNFELQASEYTVLCLDYAQNSIDSSRCESEVPDKYRLEQKEFEFKMKLVP